MMTTFSQAWSLWLAQFGFTWIVQSLVLTAVGLVVAGALRRQGAAVQSAIYRATLAAVLVAPAASVLAGALGFNGWSIPLSAIGLESHDDSRADSMGFPMAGSDAVLAAGRTNLPADGAQEQQIAVPRRDFANSPADLLAAKQALASAPRVGPGPVRGNVAARSFCIAWLAFAGVLLIRLGRSCWVGRALVRCSVPVDKQTVALYQELAGSYGIALPDVHRSPFVTSPCVVGIWRPTILLTEDDAGGDLASGDLASVLAHELAHVARRDGVWNLLRHAATSCQFMQPLLWIISRRIEATAEEVCDDSALRLGADRVQYAEQLCQIAALGLPAPAAVGIKTPRTILTRRVERILDSARALSTGISWRQSALIAAACIVTTAVAGLAGAERSLSSARAEGRRPVISAQVLQAEGSLASAGPAPDTALVAVVVEEQPAADESDKKSPARRGYLYARGYTYEDDQLKGMAIVRIDPDTGAWKRLLDDSFTFEISPDGQTIVFSREDALWNANTGDQPNPGKVFEESGSPVFSPDSRSMIVTSWKRKPGKEDESESKVSRMGIDGTNPSPLVELAGSHVCDWSPDGQWLLVERNGGIDLVRLDGKERRPLAKAGYHPRFAPDGKRAIYVQNWEGRIRTVELDGNKDKLFYQAPHMTHVVKPQFSPNGKDVGIVLQDLQFGNDGTTPVLYADPKVTHPRIAIINAAKDETRFLTLPRQEGWDFYPTGELSWR
jgi:hypothetical protein